MDFSIQNYRPPGPVAAEYIRCDSLISALMGPVGSGKTHATIFKALRHTAMMPPCRDGIIRAKGAVVRESYRTLYATTLSSWFQWFPRDYPGSKFTGGDDRPAIHELKFKTPRGRLIHLTVEFKALGSNRIEEIMRGWEGSWAWLNEVDLLDRGSPGWLQQRLRWPSKEMMNGAVLKKQVMCDLNAPDADHWIADDFVEKPIDGYRLHRQPSGTSVNAENIDNLPDNYYNDILRTQPEWKSRRFVHAEFGFSRDGQPVYPEFNFLKHVARKKLLPVKNLSINLGFDGGLHPACVISQVMPNGQWRVLEELYFGRMGPGRFSELVLLALEERYRDNPVSLAVHDPSSLYGADKEGGELSWVDIVQKALGIPLIPAPSNEPILRTEAVRNLLMYTIDAQSEGFQISPDCKMLNKGFNSHYRYRINPNTGQLLNPDSPRPEKNEFSNLHDALQYPVLAVMGRAGIISSSAKGRRAGKFTSSSNCVVQTGFNV